VVFALAQVPFLSRHRLPEPETAASPGED
jgi:hypothetical protein